MKDQSNYPDESRFASESGSNGGVKSHSMVVYDLEPTPLVVFDPEPEPMVVFHPTPLVMFEDNLRCDYSDKKVLSSISISAGALEEKDITASSNKTTIQPTQSSLEKSRIVNPDGSVDDKNSTSANLKEVIAKQAAAVKIAQHKIDEKAKALSDVKASIENTSFIYDGLYLMLGEAVVSNFTITIQEEIIMVNANSSKSFSKYKAKVTVGTNIFEDIIPGEEFDQFSWVKRVSSGKAFLLGDSADYKLYIQYLISSSKAKKTYLYDRSGWVPLYNKHYYVTSTGPIGMKGTSITTADGKTFDYESELIGKEEVYRHILNLMMNMCMDSEKSIVLELFTHLGVLTTPFEQAGFPPKFVMGLIGETNSRKTSMAIAVTQLFNRNSSQSPELSFSSTIGGIETMLQTYSDAVLLVDDLMPANTARQQYDNINKLEFLVRAYGDRVSKKRMTDFNRTGLQDSYPIRGTCLVTGEYAEGVTSSMTRMVIIYLDRKQVNNELLSFHQSNHKLLPTHFYDFLSYISGSYDDTIQYIRKRIPTLRLQARNYFNTPRFAESYSHLLTVSEIFLHYGLQRGFISTEEFNLYSQLFEEAIRKVIGNNDYDVAKKNIGVMFLIALKAYIDNGTLKCLGLDDAKVPGSDYVLVDDDHIYIKLNDAFLLSKKYWTSYGKYLPITTEDQLIQFLIPLGVIAERLEGDKLRHTLKLPRRKAGDNTRYLYIIKSAMNEKLANVQDL